MDAIKKRRRSVQSMREKSKKAEIKKMKKRIGTINLVWWWRHPRVRQGLSVLGMWILYGLQQAGFLWWIGTEAGGAEPRVSETQRVQEPNQMPVFLSPGTYIIREQITLEHDLIGVGEPDEVRVVFESQDGWQPPDPNDIQARLDCLYDPNCLRMWDA